MLVTLHAWRGGAAPLAHDFAAVSVVLSAWALLPCCRCRRRSALLSQVGDRRVYFVHSYHGTPSQENADWVLATSGKACQGPSATVPRASWKVCVLEG